MLFRSKLKIYYSVKANNKQDAETALTKLKTAVQELLDKVNKPEPPKEEAKPEQPAEAKPAAKKSATAKTAKADGEKKPAADKTAKPAAKKPAKKED